MRRLELLQAVDQEVREVLPEFPRPEQKALAGLVCGVVCAEQAQVSRASASIPGAAQDRSKLRRVQRLLANPRFDLARAQRRLLALVLARRRGRLDVLVDATTTGASAQQAGTVTVCLALAWHGRAIPLLWRSWVADAPGQDWMGALRALTQTLQDVLQDVLAAVTPTGQLQPVPPAPVVQQPVVLMADRGLSGSTLARLARERGWHYLLRVTRQTQVRDVDGVIRTVGALVPRPSLQVCLNHVRLYAPRRKVRSGPGGWARVWDEALTAQVVAVWRRQDQEAWLLVTDLPASQARCAEYRRRTWEEELFRDLKGLGWHWEQSRLRRPERVERLLLVLTLATLWMLGLGQRVLRRGRRRQLEDRRRRCYSLFQLGLRWLRRCLANDQHVLVTFRLLPVSLAPCPKLS
jgi:hypothetical protein